MQFSQSLGLIVMRHKRLSHESIQCAHTKQPQGRNQQWLSGLVSVLESDTIYKAHSHLWKITHDIHNMKAHRRTTEKGWVLRKRGIRTREASSHGMAQKNSGADY